MKATEFVAALEALIAEHGDLEVRAIKYGSGYDLPATVDYQPNCKLAQESLLVWTEGLVEFTPYVPGADFSALL